MKTLGVIAVMILLIGSTAASGKSRASFQSEIHYSVRSSYVQNGSGQNPGITLNGSITKANKSLEVGVITCPLEMKLRGADVKYKILLRKDYMLADPATRYIPYLSYNIIYQKGIGYGGRMITLGEEQYYMPTDSGVIATMGHFLEFGNKIMLTENIYVDGSLGIGVYEGAINKIDGPGTLGIHGPNHGFTYSFKLGIGVNLN